MGIIGNMRNMVTTISVDERVRDRLKAYLGGGMSYSEALMHLMDRVEADEFFRGLKRAMDDPAHPWLDKLQWR